MPCSVGVISIEATTRYACSVSYGPWIKAIRVAAGLSQTDFAERIGLKEGSAHVTVSRLETGKAKRPDTTTIERIIDAFPDAPPPPSWPKPPTNGSPTTIAVRTWEARELAIRLDKQPRAVRTQIRDVVERLLKKPRRQPRRGPKAGPAGPKSGR